MKARELLESLRRLTAREAEVIYGTSEEAKEEAYHFQEAGDRRFYAQSRASRRTS